MWLDGRLIGRIANGQAYAIHVDQTGRPETVTDASRTVVWQAQNLAFTRNVTTASITLNIGFPGQYYDGETGKWNNGYRDYDAELGRYVESDPMGLGGGVNTYAYAGNNPANNFDPLGLYCLKEWQIQGLAGAVVGAGLGAAAGSESGPGALVTGVVGALINGGIGVASGLMTNNQSSGAAAGAAGALVSSGSKIDLAGGIYGGTLGGVVSSQMQNNGYSRTTANAAGGVAGGSVGSAISGYLSGLSVPDIAKNGVKGGLIGVAAGLSQSGLEAALRSGNDCSCGK